MPEIRHSSYSTPARQNGVLDIPSHDAEVVSATNATVQRIHVGRSKLGGPARVELKIQAHDAYGYQRELSIELVRTPGSSTERRWMVRAYKHPFRPTAETVVSRAVAQRLIARIWELSTEHPGLLWNDDDEHERRPRPRHEGFVRFHELLVWGATPSVKLLD